MITVFYDGGCGVCAREIEHYQNIASPDIFEWVDITKTPDLEETYGVSPVLAMQVMHVQDHNHTLHKGVDAFIILWQYLPYYWWRYLAKITSFPPCYFIACHLYDYFVKWHAKKRKL